MNTQLLLNRTYFRLGWTKTDSSGNVIVDPTCKYPLETTTALIPLVLDEFNEKVPRKKIFKIENHVPGSSQEYGLPTEAYSIIAVYWMLDTPAMVSPDIPDLLPGQAGGAGAYADDLLEVLMNLNDFDQLQQFNREQGVDWEFVNGSAIKILERAAVRQIHVLYNYPRTIEDMSNKHLSLFTTLLGALAIEAYVNGRERTVGFQRAGGTVEFTGGTALLQMADRLRKEWDAKVEGLSKLNVVGLMD